MPISRRALPIVPAILLLLAHLPTGPLAAQATDSVPTTATEPRPLPPPVKLWHFGVAVGGVAAISLLDDDIQQWMMENRTQGMQDVADVWDEWGGFYVPTGIAVGTLGLGYLTGKPEVTRTGARVATSVLGATLVGRGVKRLVGRARPSEADDQYEFDPFSDQSSFPSGHTLTAFALSTTLADAIDNTWVDVGLYTLAAGTGVSRVVQNVHWFSDVVGGALVGITAAKFVDGKWSLFGLQSPEFLVGPQGTGLRWTVDVPALRGAPRARN
jgi:membrane-associated phospholipid phosphatase